MTQPLIRTVSDTARWVAAYRAWESGRPDALFRDPLAERLAGELGQKIAEKMNRPGALGNGWPIITRTQIIDDYVRRSVADGCDYVMNLAAGLDTRPYRLELPSELRWIEVDLPGIVDFKEQALSAEHPVCELRREALDLTDTSARSQLFETIASSARRVLVISEGLLVYLEPEQVVSLSHDLLGLASLRYWVTEVASPGIVARITRRSGGELAEAPMRFAPPNGIAFFEEQGWHLDLGRSLFREGVRLKRVPFFLRPFAWLPDADPRKPGNRPWSCVMRLERSE